DRDQPAEGEPDDDEDHHPDNADGGILTLEVGLRALAHGLRNFLHSLAAGIGAEHRLGRPDSVDDREHPTADDQPQSSHGGHFPRFFMVLGVTPPPPAPGASRMAAFKGASPRPVSARI